MNKNIKIIIALVAVILIVGVVYAYTNKSKNDQKMVTSADMANWKTYKEIQQGFEVLLPSDWNYSKNTNNPNPSYIAQSSDFSASQGEKSNTIITGSVLEINIQPINPNKIEGKKVKIAGVDGYVTEGGVYPGSKGRTVAINHNNQLFVLTLTYLDEAKGQETFNKILSSFKFIPSMGVYPPGTNDNDKSGDTTSTAPVTTSVTSAPGPYITSTTPTSGPVGTSVTLTGNNLYSINGVNIGISDSGNKAWGAESVTASKLTFKIPVDLSVGQHSITVFTGDKFTPTSNKVQFTVTAPTSMTNWKTYTNSKKGYTLSYPANYHVAFEDDLFNYDENKYENGTATGVKIQIEKATNAYPSRADVPSIKFAEKITSGPGGTFDIYNVTGINGTKYFTINVWGLENDKETIPKILSTFHFASTTN